jgi:hypothetical protein
MAQPRLRIGPHRQAPAEWPVRRRCGCRRLRRMPVRNKHLHCLQKTPGDAPQPDSLAVRAAQAEAIESFAEHAQTGLAFPRAEASDAVA